MFKLKEKIKNTTTSLLVLFLIFVQFLPISVNAATLALSESLLDTVAITGPVNRADNQMAGVSNKQQGPKVEVVFNADGAMKTGVKVTATAMPSSFRDASGTKNLYFTWYLKHEICTLTDDNYPTGEKDDGSKISKDGNSVKLARCDQDGDEIVTVNDWKIAASKIIVKGAFDSAGADYTKDIDEKLSSHEAIPSPRDDWEIGYGEDVNSDDATNCYVQEPKTGLIFEMRRVSSNLDACSDIDGVKYEKACVDTVSTSCSVLNPAYLAAVNAFIDDGTPYPVPMPSAGILQGNNVCAVTTKNESLMSCTVSDFTNFESSLSCQNNAIPMCMPADNSRISFTDTSNKATKVSGNIFGLNDFALMSRDQAICSEIHNANTNTIEPLLTPPTAPNFFESVRASFTIQNKSCANLTDAIVNGTTNIDKTEANIAELKYAPTCSFEKDVNMCKHLFPKITNKVSGGYVGDGEFTIKEKEFWGADPSKASTNGKQKDEEALTGLGVDKFSWIFSAGDQVGVVVEGDSDMPTEHTDASYKRMWAFSNNTCEELESLSSSSKQITNSEKDGKSGFYIEGVSGNKQGFLTAEVDLNKCLDDNLLDPDVGNVSELKVQLNALPENPINDSSGRGDILKVVSGATNTENQESLLYSWSVQKSRDGSISPSDSTTWQDITTGMKNSGSFLETDLVGLNKKELSINLNLQDSLVESGMNAGVYGGDVFWLRVKVKISSGAVDGSQNAEGVINIRIVQQQNEIGVYPVLANNAGMLSINNSGSNSSICNDSAGRSACYVTKNEIIGISVPKNSKSSQTPFNWFINGNEISCSLSVSAQCSTGNVLFFPIIGNVGESVDVTAKGINKDGEVIEIGRHFVIVEPQIQIISLNAASAWSKLLGYYKDLDGNKYPDYSTQVIETNTGNEVFLGGALYPSWKAGQAGFDWAIDGQIIPEFNNQNQVRLSVEKFSGESYNISLVASMLPGSAEQVNNVRKALFKNWGISPEDVIEEKNTASIQLNVIAGSSDIVASEKQSFFGASLITHLPEQLMFLLKISLTSMALFLLTGVLFAIIPERVFAKEEE